MQLPVRPAPVRDFKVWAGPGLLAEVLVRPDVLLRVAILCLFWVAILVVLPRRDFLGPVEEKDGRAVQRHVPPGDRLDVRVDGEDRHLEGPHERLVEQHEARRAVALVAARVRCCARVQIDEIGEGPEGLAVARSAFLGRRFVHDSERAREPVDLGRVHLAPLLPLPGFRQVGVLRPDSRGIARRPEASRRVRSLLLLVLWEGALPWFGRGGGSRPWHS
mmetsp:Transcript_5882/g.17614  ORF Transcript_5882/g.17614 Transcript_5882/m.17614 type:complete len:219 (+) Transcript_5882:1895-2551(+)